MANKKSLYEILELTRDASYPEISASHERLLQALESRQPTLSREDFTLQRRLLKVAHSTLSTPLSRDAYDAHLHHRSEPAGSDSTALALSTSAQQSAAQIRAEALLMRADALSLRADALGLKADLASGRLAAGAGLAEGPIASRLLSYFKTALLTLGTLAAVGMVIQVVFMFTVNRQALEAARAPMASDEKTYLQEYYQTWGVRPATRAEAEAMDAERRANEEAKRAQQRIETEKKKAEKLERDFETESRKRAEQVSAELQRAQERARQP